MEWIYSFIIVILILLAVSGLFVGVTNDAVNFLNSAFGSKVASRRVVLMVASAGIAVGTLTSSGMMEVARNGMFDPSLFTFHEVILLYLSVMIANILLLDLFNTWGLPTSTTVALVFCLLGAAVAMSIARIQHSEVLELGDIGLFIHSGRVLGIVAAILLSVVVALTIGLVVMALSRLLFTFRYMRAMHRYGALWCGLSLMAIIYFTLLKGLKPVLQGSWTESIMKEHLLYVLFVVWGGCTVLLYVLQRLGVNILRVSILGGTFALALAFAGNDLVNFIGVPVAGWDAYQIASQGKGAFMRMDALNENIPANTEFLLVAGGIMILTLWISRKAMHVTETELTLSSQYNEQTQQEYGSSAFARAVVRGTLGVVRYVDTWIPKQVKRMLARRFEVADVEHTGAPFDMIRATVNLTSAAGLIALATAFKLPLSTTYVGFMVAMGSSLADRAWGRESAVYRISGVMTVVSGWFITALGGFLMALGIGLLLIYGGKVVVFMLTLLAIYGVIRSNFIKRSPAVDKTVVERPRDVVAEIAMVTTETMVATSRIYDKTLLALRKEHRKVLRALREESEALYNQMKERKYRLMSTLKVLGHDDVDLAQYYVQAVDYLNELTKALKRIVISSYDHIDNNHEGLSHEQTTDLMKVGDEVEAINHRIGVLLTTTDFRDIDLLLAQRDHLFETLETAIKRELERVGLQEGGTRSSMLYLTILNETKTMVLQMRNLIKARRYFSEEQFVEKLPKTERRS